MHFRRYALLVGLLVAWFADSTTAQLGRHYLRPSDYRRSGLEVVWTSHVELDRNRSQISDVRLQVVGMDSYDAFMLASRPVFEVTYEYGVRRVRAFDLGRNGQPIGANEAERLAEKEMILLKARGHKPELTSRRIPPTILYIQSSNGTLHAFDAETGKTIWAVVVGNPRYQSLAPAANDNYVATINGSKLYLLDRGSGEQIWSRSLQHNPTIGPAISEEIVFASATNGHVEGHWLPKESDEDTAGEPKLEPPTWFFQGDSQVTAPMTVTLGTLSWPTLTGRVYVADLSKPAVIYRMGTGGPIYSSTIPVPPNRLALASTDGYIYCIDETNGDLIWEYSAGEAIREPIVSFGDQIYAITEFGNLHCMSAVDGSKRWLATRVRQFVSAGSDRIYVMDHLGRTLTLDQKTGGRITQLSAGTFDLALVNTKTDRLYVASRDGGIMCLREIDAEIPLLHQPIPQPESEDDSADQQAAPAGDEFSPPADAADAFEPIPGEDPFDAVEDPFDVGDDPGGPEEPMGSEEPTDGEDPFEPISEDEDPFDI